MYRSILIPVDGAGSSDIVLPWVLRLAADGGCPVHLVRVLEPTLIGLLRGTASPPPATVKPETIVAARESLHAVHDRVAAAGITVTSELLYGPPVAGILKAARAHKADLIALARRDRPGLRGLLHGSTTPGVLHREPKAAMLVIHEGHAEPTPAQRIVVPLDGSAATARVLPHVQALAAVYGSQVTLVRVLAQNFEPQVVSMDDAETQEAGSGTLFSRLGREQFERQLTEARAALREQEAGLRQAGVAVTSMLLHGPVVAGILKVAGDQNADLVALTSHAKTGAGTLFGGVSAALLNRLQRPALVVRP